MTGGLVGGRYRLGQRIGVGGMGRVWLARDEVLHRDVAIKEVLLPETPSEDEAHELRQRTLREARAAARLAHANVVRVYDVMYADDRPWIVMEYIPSRSLAQVIKRDGPMPPNEVALVGLAVLDALVAAHDVGVLHRDVKPGNVLLAEDGRVVLTDFGLATFDEVGSALTQSGVVHGSPQFIAPERALDGTSTAEADMWSLGATLFAAVEGQSPYARSTSYQTLAALATSPPDAPRRAGALKPVLAGLLRRKPSSRMKPDEVRTRLQRIANGETKRRLGIPRQDRLSGATNGHPSGDVHPSPAPGAPWPAGSPRPIGSAAAEATAARATAARAAAAGSAGTSIAGVTADATHQEGAPTAGGTKTGGGATTTDDAGSAEAGRASDQSSADNRAGAPPNGRVYQHQSLDEGSDSGEVAADAQAAVEALRPKPQPSHWPGADSRGVIKGDADAPATTQQDVRPFRRARRRWAAVIAAAVVLLAGGGYLAARQVGDDRGGSTGPSAAKTPAASGAASTPGSVAPASPAPISSSVVPIQGKVAWPCSQSRPTDTVPLPTDPKDYFGVSGGTLTWYAFDQQFPLLVPAWSIVRDSSTACLYDVAAGPMVTIHSWRPGAAAKTAKAAMQTYQADIARSVSGGIDVVSDVAEHDTYATPSATLQFDYHGEAGEMHTFARAYLVKGTAYVVAMTTFKDSPTADGSVWGAIVTGINTAQMRLATKK